MKHFTIAAIIAITAVCVNGVSAARFSDMSVEEVSALLAESELLKHDTSATAPVADSGISTVSVQPVTLTAADMMTKVYGVVDASGSKEECLSETGRLLNVVPTEDDDGLWLENADGYIVNYCGQQPDVMAMARYDDKAAVDFCFFFLFPYDDLSKEKANLLQSRFSGCLLQEIADLGVEAGENIYSQDLYEVIGNYLGNNVNVRLLDDRTGENGDGRYILMLSVEPGVSDRVAAL
ncbi:MAG: hypothetical protein NC204_04030 [Candidatus Amulumruptor caecigallinarius]|nr:hypothetical protein [Candidatus Amulumruptor caecigallinarius]